jgi:hypothetical protein
MNLPNPPPRYDAAEEAEMRAILMREDARNLKIGKNIDVRGAKLILTAPNGTRYQITVSNTGALSTTSV